MKVAHIITVKMRLSNRLPTVAILLLWRAIGSQQQQRCAVHRSLDYGRHIVCQSRTGGADERDRSPRLFRQSEREEGGRAFIQNR